MQTITITTTEHNLSGYFYVMFENHISDKIHATATTDEMKVILEEVATIGAVLVSKTQNHFVHQWHIRGYYSILVGGCCTRLLQYFVH